MREMYNVTRVFQVLQTARAHVKMVIDYDALLFMHTLTCREE